MTDFARALLGRAALDVSREVSGRSAVVLAPHPDDETLGCGATILRKTDAGTPVSVVFATDGRHSHGSRCLTPDELSAIREAEALEACRRLGVPEARVHHLRFEEMRLAEHRDAARARVREVLATLDPDEVYVPCVMDAHADHQTLAEIAIDLAVESGARHAVYEYPIWLWSWPWWRVFAVRAPLAGLGAHWTVRGGVRAPRPLLVRTAGYLHRKHAALSAYVSQMQNLTGEPDWPTLPAVGGGTFLPRFFDDHEIFFRIDPRARSGGGNARRPS